MVSVLNRSCSYQTVTLLDVEDIPEVDDYGKTDSKHGQDAVHFRSPREGHEGAASKEPHPPIEREVAARM